LPILCHHHHDHHRPFSLLRSSTSTITSTPIETTSDVASVSLLPTYWGIVINKRVYTATAEAKTLLIRSFILQLRCHVGGFK
jgi:hypothetical protein